MAGRQPHGAEQDTLALVGQIRNTGWHRSGFQVCASECTCALDQRSTPGNALNRTPALRVDIHAAYNHLPAEKSFTVMLQQLNGPMQHILVGLLVVSGKQPSVQCPTDSATAHPPMEQHWVCFFSN